MDDDDDDDNDDDCTVHEEMHTQETNSLKSA
jgi:hypothetical protein